MRLLIVVAILTAALPALAKDTAPCPSPTVKIKGPCPTEVRCSNLDEIHCPACPAPPVVNCPSPCPPLPVKECPPCLAPAPTPQAAPEPLHGVWGVPLSLGYLPGHQSALSASYGVRGKTVDTTMRADYDHSYFAGAGISYRYSYGLQVSLQGLYRPLPDASAVWTRHTRSEGTHDVRTGTAHSDVSGGHWGAMVTVVIPLGGASR